MDTASGRTLPLFTVQLGRRIVPGLFRMAYFDGETPCLTAVTGAHIGDNGSTVAAGGDKVLVHNPHGRSSAVATDSHQGRGGIGDITMLDFNETITALSCGQLPLNTDISSTLPHEGDILCVGTRNGSIRAYDVAENRDRFHRQLTNADGGVSALLMGEMSAGRQALVAAGGCTLQAFDGAGQDVYWNVSGDTIRALALLGNGKGRGEKQQRRLVVGSDDFQIRMFDNDKNDDIINTWNETAPITALEALSSTVAGRGQCFGYALGNGTVGVYDPDKGRRWRIKSKQIPVLLQAFDVDQDGVEELVTGWSNGKVDVRNDSTGEIIFRDTLPTTVAGLAVGDYRMDGTPTLITCSSEGEVRGFAPLSTGSQVDSSDKTFTIDANRIQELAQRKQDLLMELRNYEQNTGSSSVTSGEGRIYSSEETITGMIAAGTQVMASLTPVRTTAIGHDRIEEANVRLTIETTHGTVIRAAIVLAEGIFESESLVHHSSGEQQNCDRVQMALRPPRDTAYDMHIRVIVGNGSSISDDREGQRYHVFELTKQLPPFAMYALSTENPQVERSEPMNASSVSCQIELNSRQLAKWINDHFLLPSDINVEHNEHFHLNMTELRSDAPLIIDMTTDGKLTLCTDNMQLAGDLIHSLCNWINIDSLQTHAHFPNDIKRLSETLKTIQHQRKTQKQMAAQMAHQSTEIRQMVVHAEDARLMSDYKCMRQWYAQLAMTNKQLVSDYMVGCTGHQQLNEALQTVNRTVQLAARLRVGKHQQLTLKACRDAIKTSNISKLVKVIETGDM